MENHTNSTLMIEELVDENNRLKNQVEVFKKESSLEILVNNTPDIAFLLDCEGILLSANDAFIKNFDMEPEELIGKPIFETIKSKITKSRISIFKQIIDSKKSHQWQDERAGRYFESTAYPILGDDGSVKQVGCFARETTQQVLEKQRKLLKIKILKAINSNEVWKDCVEEVLCEIKDFSGLEAVAIRLIEGDDFPYFATNGLPDHFVETENYLCGLKPGDDPKGKPAEGPYVGGMCGNVISGRFDPDKDFFTEGGSFWSNNTSKFLSETTDKDRLTKTRNYCNLQGYESVALFPLKNGTKILGLLQINDKRTNMFTHDTIQFFEKIALNIGTAFSKRQTEDALAEKSMYLDNILRSATKYGIITTDIDHCITYINPLAEEFCGYKAKDAINKTIFEINARENLSPQDIEKALETVRTQGEYCYLHTQQTDDEPRYIDKRILGIHDRKDKLVGFAFFSRDITRRIKAERELQYSNLRQHAVLNNINASVYIADMDSHEILFMNDHMKQLFGEDLIGKKCYESLQENQSTPCAFCSSSKIIDDKGNPTAPYISEVQNSKFPDQWFLVHNQAIPWVNGQIVRLEISVDITSQKQTEEALQKAHDELETRVEERTRELSDSYEAVKRLMAELRNEIKQSESLQDHLIQSERLATVGKLAGTLAHEINSPLQGITFLLSSLRKECSPTIVKDIDLIKQSFFSIRDTVKNLLDLSRLTDPEKEPVEVNIAIEDALVLFHGLLKKNKISVSLGLSDDVKTIISAPQQLGQVFINLLNNSIEAITDSPGSEEQNEIVIKTSTEGHNIIITYSDTGPGIPEDALTNIFNPFYTRKKDLGLGVGLSICYSIIKNHHGSIIAKNKPEGGAMFVISLPTTTAPTVES